MEKESNSVLKEVILYLTFKPMKKLLISAILICPLIILSQDFDKAYLESLPAEIREDLIKEMGNKTTENDPVYRRPTSMIEQQKALEISRFRK